MKLDVFRVLDHGRTHTNIEVHGLLGPEGDATPRARARDALVMDPDGSRGLPDRTDGLIVAGKEPWTVHVWAVRRPIWLRLYQNAASPCR